MKKMIINDGNGFIRANLIIKALKDKKIESLILIY
jgi:hypothetical protein